MSIVYVAGPYTADTKERIQNNVESAASVAIELWRRGHVAICPHLNSAHFDSDENPPSYEVFANGYLDLLLRCDAIVVLKDYEKSRGTLAEIEMAEKWDIPIYYWPHYPEVPISEIRCPVQFRFAAAVMAKMYRTMVKKNADYGTGNIAMTGLNGVAVRMSDKMSRLLNLLGFNFNVTDATFTGRREASNEPIDDTLIDIAAYGVIGLLLKMGVWGR